MLHFLAVVFFYLVSDKLHGTCPNVANMEIFHKVLDMIHHFEDK